MFRCKNVTNIKAHRFLNFCLLKCSLIKKNDTILSDKQTKNPLFASLRSEKWVGSTITIPLQLNAHRTHRGSKERTAT